jgi:hypothetical protein
MIFRRHKAADIVRSEGRLATHFVPCLWGSSEPANRLLDVTFSGCEEVSLTDLAAKLKSEPPLAHQTKL